MELKSQLEWEDMSISELKEYNLSVDIHIHNQLDSVGEKTRDIEEIIDHQHDLNSYLVDRIRNR